MFWMNQLGARGPVNAESGGEQAGALATERSPGILQWGIDALSWWCIASLELGFAPYDRRMLGG